MKLRSHAGTDIGGLRSHNEDAHLCASQLGLFVVCDGVGGRAAGELASATAIEVIEAWVRAHISGSAERSLADRRAHREGVLVAAFQEASAKLYRLGVDEPALHGLSTTASALLIDEDSVLVVHVGDSRIYRARGREVEQLTKDHSLTEWAQKGGLSPASAARLSGIVEAIGIRERVKVEVLTCDVAEGDRFLLCTDGLYVHFDDPMALAELLGGPLAAIVPRSLALAKDREGRDNVTVLVVAVDA